jgi:hypothetical protein
MRWPARRILPELAAFRTRSIYLAEAKASVHGNSLDVQLLDTGSEVSGTAGGSCRAPNVTYYVPAQLAQPVTGRAIVGTTTRRRLTIGPR